MLKSSAPNWCWVSYNARLGGLRSRGVGSNCLVFAESQAYGIAQRERVLGP